MTSSPPARTAVNSRVSRRTSLAATAARLGGRLSRRAGLGDGTVIGGWLASKIDPDVFSRLAAGRTTALVSATNGKSTVNQMLADAVATIGPRAFNGGGSNMQPGVVMALSAAPTAPYAVLEVDEIVLGRIAAVTHPRTITLMNLSREYTRGVSMRRTMRHWRETTAAITWECTVVANADDPLVVHTARGAPRVLWVAGGATWRKDAAMCPSCYGTITWDGDDWACDGCDLRRPEPAWSADGATITGPGTAVTLQLASPGRWLVSNALFAIATAVTLGADAAAAAIAVQGVENVAGRYSRTDVDGREMRLFLVKNSASWSEAVTLADTEAPIVLAMEPFGIKDMVPQWDAPIETLAGHRVVVSGQRRYDVATLLEVAGVAHTVVPDVLDAVRSLPAGPVNVITNYSAFTDLKRRLSL